MQKDDTAESQEAKINKGINLRKEKFSSSKGIFNNVYMGQITEIVKKFNELSTTNDPNSDFGI